MGNKLQTKPHNNEANQAWPANAQELVDGLPEELLITIFEYCDYRAVRSLRRSCVRFQVCCNLAKNSFVFNQDAHISCDTVFHHLGIADNSRRDRNYRTSLRLLHVDLTKLHISNEQIEHLVTECPLIKSLKLRSCVKLTSDAFVILAQKAANLKRLDLACTRFQDHFSKYLQLDPQTIVMNLTELSNEKNGHSDIEKFLAFHTSLKKLTMSKNIHLDDLVSETLEDLQISQDMYTHIGGSFWKQFPNLKRILIPHSSRNASFYTEIPPSIAVIEIYGRDLEAKLLTPVLRTSVNLTQLTIHSTQDFNSIAACDLNMLDTVIHNLTLLSLGPFTFENFQVLKRGNRLSTLRLDSLESANLEDSDIHVLKDIAHQLEHFSLTGVRVASVFLDVIHSFKELQTLELTNVITSKSVANEMLKAIQSNETLRSTLLDLDLKGTEISNMKLLECLVDSCSVLKFIQLSECKELTSLSHTFLKLCHDREILIFHFYDDHNHYPHSPAPVVREYFLT